MKIRIASIVSTNVLALALFAALGCSSVNPLPKGADNPDLHVGRLKQVNPLEIAVLPVTNNTGKDDLPLERMREDFYKGLVRRYYTPLALSFVDQKTAVEASYTPGELQENAVLQVFLTSWDDSRWTANGEVTIEGDVFLLDVSNPTTSQALWGGRFSRRVSMSLDRASSPTDADLKNRAVDRFVEDVLASLPVRDPLHTQG